MAGVTSATFAGVEQPYFFPYSMDIAVSTIIVQPSLDTSFEISAPNVSTLWVVQNEELGNGSIVNFQNVSTTTWADQTTFTGHTGALFDDATFKGSVQVVSSINNGNGGVVLTSQDGTNVSVRDEGVSLTGMAGSNGSLNFYFQDATNAFLQHFPAPANNVVSQIHFNSATSSISLVSETGQAMGVGTFGIGLNPGSNSPVTLQSGYIDMSNRAMSNVSSINGNLVATPQPVTKWINSLAGAYPTASTPGNAGTITPIIAFSTIANHINRVSLEFQSANGGGGAPSDLTQLAVVNVQTSPPGYVGRILYLDTYSAGTTTQTGGYTFATSFDFQAIDNQAVVAMLNVTQAGNIQNGQLFSLMTQDLGTPVNQY